MNSSLVFMTPIKTISFCSLFFAAAATFATSTPIIINQSGTHVINGQHYLDKSFTAPDKPVALIRVQTPTAHGHNIHFDFKNSIVESTVSTTTPNPAEGTYGIALSIEDSRSGSKSTTVIDNVQFLYNEGYSARQTQGTVFLHGAQSVTVKDSVFDGNYLQATTFASGGGISTFGTDNLDIQNTTFSDNIVHNLTPNTGAAAGGAIYAYKDFSTSGYNATIDISDSVFSGNTATGTALARGGAIAIISDKDWGYTALNTTNARFKDNTSVLTGTNDAYSSGGGAVYLLNSAATFSANEDTFSSGNQAFYAGFTSKDEMGGFLYLKDAINGSTHSTATFDVQEHSWYVIGGGLVGAYDSIASNNSTAVINKTGKGTFTTHGSMKYFTGTLNIDHESGLTSINKGLGASNITVGKNSTLALRINGNDTLSNNNLAFSNKDGRVILTAGAALAAGNYRVATKTGLNLGEVLTYGGHYANNTFTAIKDNTTSHAIRQNHVVITDSRTLAVTDQGETLLFSTSSDADSNDNKITVYNIAKADSAAEDFCGYKILADQAELTAWEFNVLGVSQDNTVTLSFFIGDWLDLETIQIYYKENKTWDDMSRKVSNIVYADGYLSFITDVVGYTVPEPAEVATLLGLAALGFVYLRRRK